NCLIYRCGAVGDLNGVWRGGQDGAPNRGRLLGTRIIVSDDDRVGICGSRGSQFWALAFVALAATAEHHDEARLDVRAERGKRFGERIGSVGIVDKNWRAGFGGAGKIEPAFGAAQICQRLDDTSGVAAGRNDEPCGDKGVGGLEVPDEWHLHLVTLAVMQDDETLSEAVAFRGDEAEGLSCLPHADEFVSA